MTSAENDRLEQLDRQVRAVVAAQKRLARDVAGLAKQIKAWQSIDRLVEIVPALMQLHDHAGQIAQLAEITPAIVQMVGSGAKEAAFREAFEQRYGVDPDAPGLFLFRVVLAFTRSRWLRTVTITAIGTLAGVLAGAWATGSWHIQLP